MKKYVFILMLVVFVVPSITFASWWNPLSWFNNWSFNKVEKITEVKKELSEQKVISDKKIDELQKQIDELKNKDIPNVAEETKKENIVKPIIETKKETAPVVKDVCLNIDGIQADVPTGYTWAYGGICSPIVLTDLCPNYPGIQSVMPLGMYIYGDDKKCLTKDEIEEIVYSKSKAEIVKTPIESNECKNAISKWQNLNNQLSNIENLSEAADFAVFKVNPARRDVDRICELNTPMETLQPTKSTRCYASYYGSNASVTCYEN